MRRPSRPAPRLDWPPERRRRAATPPRARSHRLGVRANPGAARAAPNDFELAVFSVLWSEHCGYKHSAPLLRRLPSQRRARAAGARRERGRGRPRRRPRGRVQGRVAQPSRRAVEPFQGAATGVGGILRDVVAMGARPIALLDGLRFGAPDWHFRRAVARDRPLRQLRRRPDRRAARRCSTTPTPRTRS